MHAKQVHKEQPSKEQLAEDVEAEGHLEAEVDTSRNIEVDTYEEHPTTPTATTLHHQMLLRL